MSEHPWGVGMPAWLKLHQFGRLVHDAFGASPILVGSALRTKRVRDVDVRLPLDIDRFIRLVGPAAEFGKPGTRWASLALAYSALGREMTGLPVDFQIQHSAIDLTYADQPRLTLGESL